MASNNAKIREFNELSMELGSSFAKTQSARYMQLARELNVEVETLEMDAGLKDADTQGYVNDPK